MCDFKKPKTTQNVYDFKKMYIENLGFSLKAIAENKVDGISTNGDNKIIITTNYGLVIGTLIDFDEDSNEESTEISTDTLSKKLIEMASGSRFNEISDLEKEFNTTTKILNHTGSILLKDAVITPYSNSNNSTTLPFLVLFTDQICGFSFGSKA